jgi:hypothetical protein
VIEAFQFEYEAGTFEQYWVRYLATTANAIRKRLESNQPKLDLIKAEAEKRAKKFATKGQIIFPWQVLIATAVS